MPKADLSKAALRFLKRLPPKALRQISTKITELESNPRPPDCRPLRGYPYLRVDQGEYRIIYRVSGATLDVRLVGKRNDAEVYRQLGRME